MRWNELSDEACPVARGLAVVGDRWTMLVLRDCFLGVRRFEQFQRRLGITRHVLTDRLRKLEACGVLGREVYSERPLRHEYRLTERGKALHPVLLTLIEWSRQHLPGAQPPPYELVSRDTGKPVRPLLVDADSGVPLTWRSVRARAGGSAAQPAGED